MKEVLPIAMWSGPRNVSTAMMYSFGNRGDLRVYDEPFFGSFLKHTGVWRPSREEVLAIMECGFNKVLEHLQDASKKERLFLKNMGNHLEGGSLEVLSQFQNVILVRKPEAVIASFTQQVELPTDLDLCYKNQLEILEFLKSKSLPFYVVDSDDIKKAPRQELELLCSYLKLPFTERMLSWEAGARDEDGVWAKYWYHNVHKSTGFMPYEEKQYEVPERLAALYDDCQKDYLKIKQHIHE